MVVVPNIVEEGSGGHDGAEVTREWRARLSREPNMEKWFTTLRPNPEGAEGEFFVETSIVMVWS